MRPEDLHFSEVNGGVGPYHGIDHSYPDCTSDRGPFTGHDVNWKKHRHRHTYAIHAGRPLEDSKPTWLRSPSGSDLDPTVKSANWEAACKKDAKKAQEKAISTLRDVLRGASGKVPQLDLLRIWDSGASQGMTDRSLVSSDASVKGKKVTIHTGNGPVISDMYECTVVADGLAQ